MGVRQAIENRIKRSPLLLPLAERVHGWMWHRKALRAGTFSQHGEDRFVEQYFKGKPGTYIDIGASHPFKISNTYLLYRHGWRGITVEPIPRLSRLHQRIRPQDIHLNCAAGERHSTLTFFELIPSVLSTFDSTEAQSLLDSRTAQLRSRREVEVMTLAEICQKHLGGRSLDLLSVDAEGYDLPILKGFDWSGGASAPRPKLIICETGATTDNQRHAAELAALLEPLGYRHIQTLGCNGVYELQDDTRR